jgi:hypothetical protein
MSQSLGRLFPSKKARKEFLGDISRYAEIRLHASGDAPPRLQINGRWYYPENLLKEWLKSRLSHQPAE